MNLTELSKPLPIESVDFRIQSINNGGYATILAYKDARVDMNILDTVCGVENWKREHFEINGSMYCRVSIFNPTHNHWVSKEDVGSESMTEKEKGLSSDAFKRACFNWGIGRELYDYPVISIKLLKNEFKDVGGRKKQTFELKLKDWNWHSEFKDGEMTFLGAMDTKGNVRFRWGKMEGEGKQIDTKKKLKPYPPKNYEKAAKSIHDNKCTVNDIKEKFFLSDAAEQTIKEMVLNLDSKDISETDNTHEHTNN